MERLIKVTLLIFVIQPLALFGKVSSDMNSLSFNISGVRINMVVPGKESKDYPYYDPIININAYDFSAFENEFYGDVLSKHFWEFRNHEWLGKLSKIGWGSLSISLWKTPGEEVFSLESMKNYHQSEAFDLLRSSFGEDVTSEDIRSSYNLSITSIKSDRGVEMLWGELNKDGGVAGYGREYMVFLPIFGDRYMLLNYKAEGYGKYKDKVYRRVETELLEILNTIEVDYPNTTSN